MDVMGYCITRMSEEAQANPPITATASHRTNPSRVWAYACECVCAHPLMLVCVFLCICVCVCVCACVCVCVWDVTGESQGRP